MQEALIITTAIAFLLFVGVLCSWISSKLRIPDVLLLIITGMAFGAIQYKNVALIEFPNVFLNSVAILALAMIVFDSTARLRLRELDTFSLKAVNLTFLNTIFILVFFTIAAKYILNLPFWTSLLFSALMTGTSPEIMLEYTGKNKALMLLKLESIFNTPLTVILPFLVLDLMEKIKITMLTEIIEQATPFVMKFIVGIGTGVFIGIVLFKVVQKAYTQVYSPLAVIVAALLSYVLAENLGGSGVLAVTALGLFFGNAYAKDKINLLGAESVLAKALYILVFMLAGLVIKIPYTTEFFITSAIMFGVYTIIRFAGCWTSVKNAKEAIYMALNAPKGVATAAVVFMLAVHNIEGISTIIDMTFAFILYSIILSAITTWVTKLENHTARH
ncbi:Na(+)/H(+) antiporter 1 [uncultured archaeon]|nr:Na(+)/H(+) antiporter 1 [uncultured archaeon]